MKVKKKLSKWKVFEKYRNIARRIASNFHKQYPKYSYKKLCEWGEYALAMELWGRKQYRAKFGAKRSTWLYTVIYFHIKQVLSTGVHPCPYYKGFLRVTVRERAKEVPLSTLKRDDKPTVEPVFKLSRIESILAELSEDAQSLMLTVLKAPAELNKIVSIKNAKPAREYVAAYMIDELDWTRDRVSRAWSEVQECLV